MKGTTTLVAILGFSIALSGCSSKVMGPYSGKARASALIDNVIDGVKYSDKKSWSTEDTTAIALVKDDGGERTVDFEETDFLKYCVKLSEKARGQTCGISINGTTETLEIDSVSFTPASAVGPDGAMISIQGITKQSKTFVDVLFSGVPYDGKK